jgi:hypothetical protein
MQPRPHSDDKTVIPTPATTDVAHARREALRPEKRQHELWRLALGQRYEGAVRDRDSCVMLTADPEAKIRRIGLALLALHWPPAPELEQRYLEAIRSDPDINVKNRAIYCLAKIWYGSRSRMASLPLARLARDPAQVPELRASAYQAVMMIMGAQLSPSIIYQLGTHAEHLPEDLDWHVIDAVLS